MGSIADPQDGSPPDSIGGSSGGDSSAPPGESRSAVEVIDVDDGRVNGIKSAVVYHTNSNVFDFPPE